MAQDGRRKPAGSGGKPTSSAGKPTGKPKQPAGQSKQPTGQSKQPAGQGARKSAPRLSVAAARESSSSKNNRTQLIIGSVAIVVIVLIIIGGVIYTQKQSQVQGEGYGPSTQSVATADQNGVVTVSKPGSSPGVTIDIYEDALCPICAQFEKQFGQQIGQALDAGTLKVNYHMLNFLNPSSFSGDYSTRAAAALLCVAQNDGSKAGVYMGMHSWLMSVDNQPEEQGTSDYTNQQLADQAATIGATSSTECISSGQNVEAAAASAQTSSDTLSAVTGGRVATPTVVYNGAPVAQLTTDWLTNLLPQQ